MFQFLQCGEVLSSVYYFVTHLLKIFSYLFCMINITYTVVGLSTMIFLSTVAKCTITTQGSEIGWQFFIIYDQTLQIYSYTLVAKFDIHSRVSSLIGDFKGVWGPVFCQIGSVQGITEPFYCAICTL